ncbi:hypothetical protein [Verrucosispora sp. WMMC514]|nr:hypothetical protein [Verrucosispora sp. WMMC514]WBB90266.1 hypothetical protein O7597_25300 [Verrucosispora sp. WMMC514]
MSRWRRFWWWLRRRPRPLADGRQWRETVEQEAARQRLLDQARSSARWLA